MTNETNPPQPAAERHRAEGDAPADGWDREAADAGDEPVQDALVDESDRLMRAVDEIKRLESEKRRLPISTPEFHRVAARIERMARQVFGIAKAQREVGEALQSRHDESIEDEARDRDGAGRESAATGGDRGS